jgi:riboflavin synthase
VFTGLVEAAGRLRARTSRGPGARLQIGTDLGPLSIGESIAVSGVCLTVQAIVGGGFECDASAETLARSTLGALPLGGRVHLERALPLGGRMGGHIVTGHVDARIQLRERRLQGEAIELVFEVDATLSRFIAPKGSVAVDGVSLTVNGATANRFDVVIIPHTLAVTALGDIPIGGEANLEVDLVARYVARLLASPEAAAAPPSPDAVLVAKLKSSGYL